MKLVGLPYSGTYGFVETEMNWPSTTWWRRRSKAVVLRGVPHADRARASRASRDFYMPGPRPQRLASTASASLRHPAHRCGRRVCTRAHVSVFLEAQRAREGRSMNREYVYKGFERFWHWTQALLILFLALTGFEIHGSFALLRLRAGRALPQHRGAGPSRAHRLRHLLALHDRRVAPVPADAENLRAQVEYYLVGIFRDAPHPTRKTPLSKLNPLQRLVYLGLKLLVIPVDRDLGAALHVLPLPAEPRDRRARRERAPGRSPSSTPRAPSSSSRFVVAHLYLITTGRTRHVEPEGDDHRLRGSREHEPSPAARPAATNRAREVAA